MIHSEAQRLAGAAEDLRELGVWLLGFTCAEEACFLFTYVSVTFLIEGFALM